jgi:biotin carboxyl carrier protein
MLKIKVNGKTEHQLEIAPSGNAGLINGHEFTVNALKIDERNFNIIKDNKSFNVEIIEKNLQEKLISLKVNGRRYNLEVKDRFDELLKSLGMEIAGSGKVNEIKAPMPGLVLDIMVSPGQEVKKGDPIMILEAMKMENILKSPSDGIVKKVAVERRQAVEKNQVLVNFE